MNSFYAESAKGRGAQTVILVVSLLDCGSIERFDVQTPARAELWFEISAPSTPLANSDMMSTLTIHCQWEDETVRERTSHAPSYAEAKKIKWPTFIPMAALEEA